AQPINKNTNSATSVNIPLRRSAMELLDTTALQHITHATNRVQQFLFERPVELGPQAFDRDFDDVGVAVEIDVPDHFGDGGFREDFTLAPGQDAEQRELLGGQLQS